LATIETRTAWGVQAARPEVDGPFAGDLRRSSLGHDTNDSGIDDPKWPAWKVTAAVVIVCGAFWMGAGYVAMRLLG
jgi:hypothetical protein